MGDPMRTACVIGSGWYAQIVPAIARALSSLGIETRGIELPYVPAGYARLPKLLRRKLAAPALRLVARQNLRQLRCELSGMHYDLILVTMCHWLDDEGVQWLRRHARQVVYWSMDDPFISWTNPPAARTALLRAYQHLDWLLVFDGHYTAQLRSHYRCRVAHLPLAYDDRVYRPGPEAVCRELAFVGDSFPNRIAALDALTECTVDTWGGNFAATARRRVHPPIPPAEASTIYRTSRINLNVNHPQSIRGNNTRVYEVTGSGGFLLTDDKAELAEQFVPGKELETFRSLDELRDKVRYYLAHPDAAAAIARRGLVRAQREHTYRHRMRTLLQLLAGKENKT